MRCSKTSIDTMETHHEQVHRRSAASRRDCNEAGEDPHGRAQPAAGSSFTKPAWPITARWNDGSRTTVSMLSGRPPTGCQPLRSPLCQCSEHDRVPGVPPPRVRSRPACLPPSRPHCHLVELDRMPMPSVAASSVIQGRGLQWGRTERMWVAQVRRLRRNSSIGHGCAPYQFAASRCLRIPRIRP
jgi:hypothetical protein